MALRLKQPFVVLVDNLRVLRNPHGLRRISRIAFGCSQARNVSTSAHMVPTIAPYGTRKVAVRILTIPKNTDIP